MKPLFACYLLLLLVACQHTVPTPAGPVSIEGNAYRFNVVQINVIDDYHSSGQLPYVEQHFATPPAHAIRQWAEQQLSAGGNTGRLDVVILDASVKHTALSKQKHGLKGAFTKEHTEQFDGSVIVELRLYTDERLLPVAQMKVSAKQMHTLREDANVPERKALHNKMTSDLMKTLLDAVDKNIGQYFSNYLM